MPLSSNELAILPHLLRYLATHTQGAALLRDLSGPVESEVKKAGINLKRIDSGIRRVIQHLRHQGILAHSNRGVVLMTRQGWDTARHYV